jgi:hypothetical protein
MFIVHFDNNAMVCETQQEAIDIVDSLTQDGYNYITVSHNQPLDIEDMAEIDIEI